MRIPMTGRVLDVTFRYTRYNPPKQIGNTFVTVMTECLITEVGNRDTVIGVGSACCSLKDSFVKESGRKVSLTRALFNGGFNRIERTVIWKSYLNRAAIQAEIESYEQPVAT